MLKYTIVKIETLTPYFTLFQSWLTPKESAYISSFRLEEDRLGRLTVRALARLLLAQEYGGTPSDFLLEKQTKGDVLCLHKDLFLSFSHTRQYVAVAISNQACGIDIEDKARAVQRESIAKRFFDEEEVQRFLGNPDLFFKMWTAKEAFYKYRKGELQNPLKEIKTSKDFSSIEYAGKFYDLFNTEFVDDKMTLTLSIVGGRQCIYIDAKDVFSEGFNMIF